MTTLCSSRMFLTINLISHNVQLVIPAKAGIQSIALLDTGCRRCDECNSVGVCALRWSAELHG